jgi:hypothetical protein
MHEKLYYTISTNQLKMMQGRPGLVTHGSWSNYKPLDGCRRRIRVMMWQGSTRLESFTQFIRHKAGYWYRRNRSTCLGNCSSVFFKVLNKKKVFFHIIYIIIYSKNITVRSHWHWRSGFIQSSTAPLFCTEL